VETLVERDVWLSMQPFAEHDHTFPTADSMEKNRQVCQGTDQVYRWAKKHGVKLAWGTDLLFEPANAARQRDMMTRLGAHFTTVEALKMVTSGNAALFRLAGERDPYKSAPLGELTVGAWADVLLLSGDPTTDLTVLADPSRNIALIVKDGVIVKNTHATTRDSSGWALTPPPQPQVRRTGIREGAEQHLG
jgi:imidazolonepropionase-like amidohydrolase